ncbi:hypothetical protein JAO78_007535 [Alishewanella sp. 16-MA]|uniref:Uncharacterized protein n=1 Tax=Alishewanella maricola TaxID=2795740 RepID=A0ABS8C2V6_9ALTE|nr:hypothetical protein [Alishewanella maricola]MCB5226668.1 hypothetical protein [Alishewanella maricola]
MQIAKSEAKLSSPKMKMLKYGLYVAVSLSVIFILLSLDKTHNTTDIKVVDSKTIESSLNNIESTSTSNLGSRLKLAEKATDELHFEEYFKSLSENEKDKIILLNAFLFNLVNRPSNEEFEILLSQGYPNKSELNFTSLNRFDEVSIMLLNNKIENYPLQSEFPININSLRVLNFVNTVAEIEKVISYYHTDFKFSSGVNPNSSWIDGGDKMPSQVKEALESLVYSNAALSTDTGLELLAKAKFEEMMSYWNNEDASNNDTLFKHLSVASKKLPFIGIDDYVKSKYPENYEGYLMLKYQDDK